MPSERYLVYNTQPSYINSTHLEKNSSLSLVRTTPHHLGDSQTDQPHWVCEKYSDYLVAKIAQPQGVSVAMADVSQGKEIIL